MTQTDDYKLQSYTFTLPEELIAQHPPLERTASRLMVLDKQDGSLATGGFSDILSHLPANSLLVANNSKVVPARLAGTRKGGGKAEFLLLTPLPLIAGQALPASGLFPGWQRARAEGLLRPAKKINPGDIISVNDSLAVELIEKGPFGRSVVHLVWRGDLQELLEQAGEIPLPPYIRRKDDKDAAGEWGTDTDRYQTTYARHDKAGSVAAPTAGLHFTPELVQALRDQGHDWAEVTLYVGYGTFSPVRSEDIRDHEMHAENVELPEETAAAVMEAKRQGRPVIAVGTTSCRVLEGVAELQNPAKSGIAIPVSAYSGAINTFIYPGRKLRIIDGIITNFHLPESSLLMLVSAIAGREKVLAAYHKAVEERFRFFSYGDAMLIR